MSGARGDSVNLRFFYLVLVAMGGIIAHLTSEFAAMGSDARQLVLSPRHWYLALGVAAAGWYLTVRIHSLATHAGSGRDFKRMLNMGLDTLPFRGSGLAYYALTALLQFAVGMATEFGEGAPIEGHDIVAGVGGALCIAIMLAALAKCISRRLPDIVDAIALVFALPAPSNGVATAAAMRATPIVRNSIESPQLFNRPPPLRFAHQSM